MGLRKRGMRLTLRTGGMLELGASKLSQKFHAAVAAVTKSASGCEEKNV